MSSDAACATSAVQDTVVVVWHGEPTIPRVNALVEDLRAVAQRNEGRVFMLNVVTAPMPLPSAETRAVLQKHFLAMKGQLIAGAMIVEKVGVEGPLHRAVLSTLITITRQPFAMKVFAKRTEGATWLSAQGCKAQASMLTQRADSLARQFHEFTASLGG